MRRVNVKFVRHAQSEANVGKITRGRWDTPLTEFGQLQAVRMARTLSPLPSLIVMSRMVRARETAEKIMEALGDIPCAFHEIHEFNMIGDIYYSGTTHDTREIVRREYWKNADVHTVYGDGAESFYEFIGRVMTALDFLSASHVDNILVVTHLNFLRAVAWILETRYTSRDDLDMRSFYDFCGRTYFSNCQIFEAVLPL